MLGQAFVKPGQPGRQRQQMPPAGRSIRSAIPGNSGRSEPPSVSTRRLSNATSSNGHPQSLTLSQQGVPGPIGGEHTGQCHVIPAPLLNHSHDQSFPHVPREVQVDVRVAVGLRHCQYYQFLADHRDLDQEARAMHA